MLPKVLCFLAITAFAASAPYSDQKYIEDLQKEYQDDTYEGGQVTDNYGKLEDDSVKFQDQQSEEEDIEQFEDGDEQTFGKTEEDIFHKPSSALKDTELIDPEENIEQYDQSTGDELKEEEQVEQYDQSTGDELKEEEPVEQVDQSLGNDEENIENFDQTTGDEQNEIEQAEQKDDYWNQHDDSDNHAGSEIKQEEELRDNLESDSTLGKLFGKSDVQEPEDTYGSFEPQQTKQTEKQLPEVGREYNYNQDQLPKEEIVEHELFPLYNTNYESAKNNEFYTPEPYEAEVYTKKSPWYKRFWGKTKETARNLAHKVKETVGK